MLRLFYLDASALAKRYAPEAGTLLLNHLFASVPADRLYVFNVGMAEVASVLVRKRNVGHLTAAEFAQAMAIFGTEVVRAAGVRKFIAGNGLVSAALPLIEARSINGTDAILLRSALNLAASLRTRGQDLVLVASDQRLLRAAQAEGLTTFDPETESQAVLDALLLP